MYWLEVVRLQGFLVITCLATKSQKCHHNLVNVRTPLGSVQPRGGGGGLSSSKQLHLHPFGNSFPVAEKKGPSSLHLSHMVLQKWFAFNFILRDKTLTFFWLSRCTE